MTRLNKLLHDLCPDGVEYVPLWSVTIWDKKFSGVDRKKQPETINYNYLLASDLFSLETDSGNVFLLSTGEKTGWTTEELAGQNLHEGEVVTIPWGKSRAVIDCIKYYKGKFVTADNRIMTSNDTTKLSNRYLYYWVMSVGKVIDSFYRGSGIKHPNMAKVLDLRLPVPPLKVQQEIVRILDQFTQLTAELTAELTARRKQFTFYQTALFQQVQNAAVKYLNEISENCDNLRKPVTSENRTKGSYPYYGASGIVDYVDNYIFDGDYLLVSEDGANLLARSTPIAFSITGKNWVNNHAHVLHFEEYATRRYVEFYLNATDLSPYVTGGAQPKLNQKNLNRIPIPLPPLPEQRRIVAILDRFEALCNDLTSGLPAEIAARQKQYEYYRDKLLTFPEHTEQR